MKKTKFKTNRNIYGDVSLIDYAPKVKGQLEFFTINEFISDERLEEEYKKRSLVPAHPQMINDCGDERLDKMGFVGTHWKDKNGKWCFAAFGRFVDEQNVNVDRRDSDWGACWWFAGVRKSSDPKNPSSSSDTLTLEQRVERLEKWVKQIAPLE